MLLRKLGSPLLVLVVLVVATFLPRATGGASPKVAPDCRLKGHKLYGKVKAVKAFPDLKVQIVSSFPDLKVKIVDSFPDKCGLWKMVDSFPDLKIQFVDAFPDLKISYVSTFPGLP